MRHLVVFLYLCVSWNHAADAEFWQRMAETYRASGELALEELALQRVLESNPGDETAGTRLVQVKAERENRGKGSIAERFRQIEETLKQDEGRDRPFEGEDVLNSETNLERRIQGFEEGMSRPGLTDGQKERLKQILARLWFEQGIVEAENERVRTSIDAFEKSVFYNPDFQLSHYELGYLYFRIRELARGISSLERFLKLQPNGVLARNVRENLLSQYIKMARKYFFRKDFDNCLPVLRKIMSFDPRSAEAQQARNYLMDLYFYQGMDNLELGNFENASRSFHEALVTMQAAPELDSRFFSRLAQHAVQPFMKYAQKLFLIDKDYGQAHTYFQAVTWLVPGSPESFLAKEYIKDIARFNGTVKNPVVYMSGLVEEESRRFLAELEEIRTARR